MAEPPVPGARLLVSPGDVAQAWERLAAQLQPVVDAGDCVFMGVMLGGMVPLVEITQRLAGDFVLDYCHLTRYMGSATGGEVRWLVRPRQVLHGRTVVLVDDIFDQGHTLAELRRYCLAAGAARVLTAVLVHKHHTRPQAALSPDFAGLEIGDEYVFGCGMDHQERWRHLPGLYALAAPAAGDEGRPCALR